MTTLVEQIEKAPVSFVIAVAYVGLALVTGAVTAEPKLLHEYGMCAPFLLFDEPWRLVTAAFLHGGLVHLLFNLYCLVLFGPMLERSLGRVRYILLYLVAAVAGNVSAVLWTTSPYGGVVGGSGALFGMFGAYLAMQMRTGRHLFDAFQFVGPRSIVFMIGINLLIGFLIPFVSNSAHIGGLVGGFVLTFVFLDRGRFGARVDGLGRAIQIGWIALFGSLVIYSMDPVANTSRHILGVHMRSWSKEHLEQEIADLAEPAQDALRGWHARLR